MLKRFRIYLLIFYLLLVGLSPVSAQWINKPPPGVQVNWGHPLAQGPVGLWLVNEGAGNRLADISGKGNYGTLTNMEANDWVGSLHGGALDFDGNNDSVSTASTINFGGTKILTVTFWLNWDTFTNDDSLVMELSSNYNNNNGCFIIDPNAANGKFQMAIQDGVASALRRTESFTRPTASVWHHYVIVLDNRTITGDIIAYVDAVEQSTSIEQEGKDQNSDFKTDILYFMSRAGSSLFGAGKLDQIIIYDRGLSAQEVKQLYAGPYAMFQQRQAWRFYIAPAVGGIPIFYHHYKQMGN